MRIAVVGAGGVGGYFGGRLAQGGSQVVFIARGEHLDAMQTQGLRVESIKGNFTVSPVEAVDDPVKAGPVDAVLVCVKTWQVPEAAQAIRPMLGAETFVVPLENGVDAPGELAAVLGRERVLGGLCQISSSIVSPGVIRHVGIEPYVAIGELDRRPSERAERLRQAFEQSGVRVEIPDDIQAAMWLKFLFIAVLGGVGGVTGVPVGVSRSLPETRQMLVDGLEEIYRLAKAREVDLPEEAVDKTLAFIDSLPPGTMASMQRDILDGRPSELESQNGAIVRMGKESGVETPLHAFLYSSLLPKELRARGQLEFS